MINGGLEIGRSQACLFANSRQHMRTNLIPIMESKNVVRPATLAEYTVRTRLPFDGPAGT